MRDNTLTGRKKEKRTTESGRKDAIAPGKETDTDRQTRERERERERVQTLTKETTESRSEDAIATV